MQVRSSITITAPEPAIVPAAASASIASATSRPSGPSTGAEAPPGMIALSARPSGDAAAAALDQVAQGRATSAARSCRGAATWPESESRRVPLLCSVPSSAYFSRAHAQDRAARSRASRRCSAASGAGTRRRRPGTAAWRSAGRARRSATTAAPSPRRRCRRRRRGAARSRACSPSRTARAPTRPRSRACCEGGAQHLVLGQVLAADVDEGRASARDREAHDQDALEQRVRVAQDQLAVLERARLGLVGVDDDVALGAGREEARLAAGREAGAAAAAQARGAELGDLLAASCLDGALQLRVAAVLPRRRRGRAGRRRRPAGRWPPGRCVGRTFRHAVPPVVGAARRRTTARRRPRGGSARGSARRPRRPGAQPQPPRHSTLRSVIVPSAVVSPCGCRARPRTASITSPAPHSAHERLVQTSITCVPTGSRKNMS